MIKRQQISITVDEKTAMLFENAPEYKKQSLGVLLSEWLQPSEDQDQLSMLMDKIGFDAISKGLTKEKLESIISGEDVADSN